MQFIDVVRAYAEFEKELVDAGKAPMRHTKLGFWGAADMHDCYEFGKRIDLKSKNGFLDLGCGDGRIVLVASLFTKSLGVDIDEELVAKGNEMIALLKADKKKCSFVAKNFYDVDYSDFDVLFIYPDKPFELKLEKKIAQECKGMLYVYNDIYRPKFLKFNRIIWVDQTPIKEYLSEIK